MADDDSESSQVVTQQDGEATVTLSLSQPGTGRLQVQVTTDPSSPAVGVNVGAVDQTVTFANGQFEAAVTVPILSGAPNPGEVDVNLTISSVDPPPDLTYLGAVGAEDPGVGCHDPSANRLHTGQTPRNRADFQQTDEPGRGLQRE